MRSLRPLAILALAALTSLSAVLSGCSYRNGDINKVVDPYWDKSYFDPDTIWHYRATIVDTAPGSSGYWWGTVGDGHWLLVERVRWEITEHQLIGYRDYASAPGTDGDLWDGAEDVYEGQPVAIFEIRDHFDLRRSYDTMTGEETNVIEENTERPWYERQYIRVDWSVNKAPTMNFAVMLHQLPQAYEFEVQANDPGDPKRWRFDDGYFEVTSRGAFEPDLYSYYGFNGPGYMYDGAPVVLDIRHSFAKVDEAEERNYEVTHMPPSVVLEDENGDEVRDANGYAVRVPIWDRFGFYSTFGRNYWDADRGFTDGGRQFHATTFNIWEKSVNDDGSVIPVAEREPKPIIYYTNVTHPKALLDASINRVGGEWNQAFKEAVFYAQPGKYASLDDVPDMFEVRENDCNVANVQDLLSRLGPEIRDQVTTAAAEPESGFDGSIDSVKARYDHATDVSTTDSYTARTAEETQALEDLERICSALEYYTDPEISRDPSVTPFTYQRFGDVRYSMLNLIMQDHNNAWLGYGPMLSDPKSGRTVSANANIAVAHLDRSVERINQMIDAMNGLVDFGDLIYGFDVQAYMAEKLAASKHLTSFEPSDELRQSMQRRFAGLGPSQEALREMSPDAPQKRLERLKGTSFEHLLVSPQDAVLFGAADPAIAANGDVEIDEAMLEALSPARGRNNLRHEAHERLTQKLGERCMDTPEFIDRFSFGIATRLKDIADRAERVRRIREELYVAVQLHEVGHNVGLFHNFEASTDALNYIPGFWELQELPADMNQAVGVVSTNEQVEMLQKCLDEQSRLQDQYGVDVTFTTQECLGQTELMYSSIMDYHGTWNGDFGGLGPYDKAAIKFGYGKLVEVFPEQNLVLSGNTADMKRWTYLNDWRDIPTDLVNSYAAVSQREYVPFTWGPASTKTSLPDNAVPYRFCPGGTTGNTPWCRTGDFGPDMRTNAAWMETRYYQYYFFSHFNRDRMWDYGGDGMMRAMNSDTAVMADYTKKMQWYVFMKLTDPDFAGSYAEEDFLATTIMGLNHIAHVLGQPQSGHFVTVPKFDTTGYTNEMPDEDRLAPSDIMMPWEYLYQCEARSYANIDNNTGEPVSGKPGYRVTEIKLGDGRPFFLGLTEDYEEWYVRYIGSYWAKWDALYYLGYNFAWFPRTNYIVDPRVYDVSWYRLFPDEVGDIIHKLVLANDPELGPVVDANGNYKMRDVLDPNTGLPPDYTGYTKVLPSISYNHQYLGLAFAHAFMSSQFDDETDFLKSFKVAVEGADDDFGAFDAVIQQAIDNGQDPSEVVAEFSHPATGTRLRALKVGNNPVAYDLVRRLNVLKARYEVLDTCVNDETARATDPYCACVQSVEVRPNGDRFCSDPFLEAPGTGECALYDLERRRDSAYERMEDMVDFIDDVRGMNRLYSEW